MNNIESQVKYSSNKTFLEIEPPIYDGKGSINQYIKRVEAFKNKLIEDKYDVILEFINLWLGMEYTSLTELKNTYEYNLLKNPKHNRSVVRKYSDIFQNRFEIDLSVGLETDSDEINDKYIIYLLMKMLGTIGYCLTKRNFGNKVAYTVKKKSY